MVCYFFILLSTRCRTNEHFSFIHPHSWHMFNYTLRFIANDSPISWDFFISVCCSHDIYIYVKFQCMIFEEQSSSRFCQFCSSVRISRTSVSSYIDLAALKIIKQFLTEVAQLLPIPTIIMVVFIENSFILNWLQTDVNLRFMRH